MVTENALGAFRENRHHSIQQLDKETVAESLVPSCSRFPFRSRESTLVKSGGIENLEVPVQT